MEQLFAAGQENLQNFLALQESIGNAFAKMYDLNSETLKNNIQQVNQATRAIANGKTPQDKTTAITQALAPVQQQVMDYNKQLFDLFSQVRHEIQENVADIHQDCQKCATTAIENFSKNTPAGAEPFVSYLKSAIAAGNKVFEGITSATQQAVYTTTNNLKAQTEQIIQEAQKASSVATSVVSAHGGSKK